MTTETITRYHLSFVFSEEAHEFETPEAAGRAFAEADGALAPRVIATSGRGARTIARSIRAGDGMAKAAPTLINVLADPADADQAFWLAYHDAQAALAA